MNQNLPLGSATDSRRYAKLTHLVSVVQSDVANLDNIQQRGDAVIHPGYGAWLAAMADSAGGRVVDLETNELRASRMWLPASRTHV